MRPGTSSRGVRSGSADRDYVTDAMVVAAVLVSVGLIAVSVTLNARMAYRSADTVFDAWVYALAAGFADALKAYAPFAVHAGWRNRDVVAVIAALTVFVTVTAYAFSEVGFALLHRASSAAS